jgi:hypothetical protein
MKQVTAFISWIVFALYINLVAPVGFLNIFTFFFILGTAIFASATLFLYKIKQKLCLTLYLEILMILVYFHLFNGLNFILLTALMVFLFRKSTS